MVADGAVALRLSDVTGEWKRWSGRSPHCAWRRIVGRGPTQGRQIKTVQQRCPPVHKPGGPEVYIENGRGSEHVVHAEDEQFAVIFFRATVKTETGSKRIHRQVRQSEVGKSAK